MNHNLNLYHESFEAGTKKEARIKTLWGSKRVFVHQAAEICGEQYNATRNKLPTSRAL